MSSAIVIRHIEDSVSPLINTYGFSCDGTKNSMIMKVPKELGRGSFHSIFINKDLTLGITKLNLTRPIIMHYENYNNQFETTYCLSGHIGYAETGIVETGLRKNEYGILMIKNRGIQIVQKQYYVFASKSRLPNRRNRFVIGQIFRKKMNIY